MTEEEKGIIQHVNIIIKEGLDGEDDIQLILEKLLNLIQKQQKEIEHLKNLNNHQSKDIQKAVDYTFELNKELEKKDKIIDEMSIFITNLDIDEDICKQQIGQFCKEEACEVSLDSCVICIKQYFEKKVEV